MSRNDPCHPDPLPLSSEEFARGASDWLARADGPSRRTVLKRMAAALALAGIGGVGCSDRPTSEKLVAQTRGPEHGHPGNPVAYATTMMLGGYGRGAIATSREGRPIKVDGNPQHPASLGGSDVFMQASILDLYDPTRSQTPTFAGQPTDWGAFDAALRARLDGLRKTGGAGLRILSGTVTSPTLAAQMRGLQKTFPESRWHHFDPLGRQNITAGTIVAFARPLSVVHDLRRAKVIVALDADFLTDEPGSLRHVRDFADGRRVRVGQMRMNRLHVAESAFTLTGSMADHRLPLRPTAVASLAHALAAACGVAVGNAMTANDPKICRWLKTAAADLRASAGSSLVLAGEPQPPEVHALCHAINAMLGNVGRTILYVEPIEVAAGDASRSLAALVDDLRADRVETLLVLGDDPAFTAPADSGFAEALEKLSTARKPDNSLAHWTAHLGTRANATAFRCQWHLPEAHYLEAWGDARAFDGTASIVQPLTAPLYGGRSIHEVVERLLNDVPRGGYEIVREHWRQEWGDQRFESGWQDALVRGVIDGSAARAIDVLLLESRGVPAPIGPGTARLATDELPHSLDIVFRPDPSVRDGAFIQNAWLQELPRPFTKLVWDNAAWLSPATATAHGVAPGDVVRLAVAGRAIEIPVGILPGTPDGTVTLHLGYGQTFDDDVGAIGANAYALRTSDALGFESGATLTKVDPSHPLVFTRSHHAMDGATGGATNDTASPLAVINAQSTPDERDASRGIVRVTSLAALAANPDIIKDLGGAREKKPLLPLYPEWDYSKGYQWGMSIDLTACIGCNACVIACQAENNIPVVGKVEVARQREMHWLRIDDYFAGDAANPQVTHQPVPCMHCEHAPCEVVCPVGATTHSVEGLNQMTYNRCVGTRYCSNNCPYKVRRFNFFDYTRGLRDSPQKQMLQNPEVTVRARGVMEKCTYCVQRLQRTRIDAERLRVDASERARAATVDATRKAILVDADASEFDLLDRLETACAQACPARAIAFGSIIPVAGQPTALMAAKAQPTDYVLLRELNTKPRTSYLGRITNPAGDGGAT